MTQARASVGRSKAGRKTSNPLMKALNDVGWQIGVPTDELLLPVVRRLEPRATVTPAMISNTVRGRGSVAIAAAITWILASDAGALWPEMPEARRAQIDALRSAHYGRASACCSS